MSKLTPELEHFFAESQRRLDIALRAVIAPPSQPIENLDDAIAYALGLDEGAPASGKRIRPALCLLTAHCLGADTNTAMPFAAAIEIMHNFCLVHDDIEDGDEYRRGRPSVWKQFGLPHAVNTGDYLFTKIFHALLMDTKSASVDSEKRLQFFALMADTLDHTHRGQALDMNARGKAIGIKAYMRLVTEKTGYYLAAPLVAGAIAADAAQNTQIALRDLGLLIGPMFQIRDDLIDLTRAKGREAVGSDIREGKRSFMAAFICDKAPHNARAELLSILDLPREHTMPEHISAALDIYEKHGAFTEAERMCSELKRKALASLRSLPDRLRENLETVTEYLAQRQA
ncbi:MAG: polyprenyl synthetase family protein [bacterium]|nr:polyprenyl synthetase family protein [Candidatus Sumerlaeota bacterium]